MSDPYEIVVTGSSGGNPYGGWGSYGTTASYGHPTTGEDIEGDAELNLYDIFGYDPYGEGGPYYNPTGVGAGYDNDGLTATDVPTQDTSPNPNSTGDIGGIEDQIEDIYGGGNDQGNTEAANIPPAVTDPYERVYTTDDWIYQGDGNFEDPYGTIANADDYGVEVDPSWEAGGSYSVDGGGNVVSNNQPVPTDTTNDTAGDGSINVIGGIIPNIGPFPSNDQPIDDTTDTADEGIGVIPVGGGSTDDGGIDTPDIIPVPEEPPVSVLDGINDFIGSPAATAAGGVASAIGGAVNINNQFDFLEQSAEDQILANRNAAVDSGQMQNPDFFNPYGSQTTTGGTIGPDGQIIRPTVTQAFTPDQQALFDTEQSNKQGLADLTQGQVGRVGEQFGNEFSTEGFIDRHRPDGSNLDPYGNINLDALSARQTQPGVTGRNAITDSIIQREQPRFDRAEEQMKNDLLIRGFNPGTEGYTEQTDEFGRAQNDFNLAAQQAGAQEQSRLFGLESNLRGQQLNEQDTLRYGNAANRGQQVGEQLDYGQFASDERAREFQEAMSLRNQPLNELNSLRTGSQAQLPQFQQYQGSGVGAPDYMNLGANQSNVAGNLSDSFFDLTKGALGSLGWERFNQTGA